MSNYTIEVTENVVNLDVLKDHDIIIEIKSSDNFITFDTPSGYPILFTSGILPVSRVGSGYLIENLTSGNTIVRTFGNQSISGIKVFNDNVIISGYLATKAEASNIGASHFPVFISDPSTFARNIHTRTPSQFKSDLAINNVQNIALTGVNFSAGSGLIGGGNLSANRSFDIGQGDGLVVSTDNIAVDSTVVRTTGEQTLSGAKTFSGGAGIKITTGAIGINRKDIILKGNTGTLFNNTVTITPTNSLYTDRVYYLPEAGVDADFVMTAGSQIIVGQKTFTSTVIFNSGTFTSLMVGATPVALSGHTHTSLNLGSANLDTYLRIQVPAGYQPNDYQDNSAFEILNNEVGSTVFAIDGYGVIKTGTIDVSNVNGLNDAISSQIPTSIVYTSGNQSISGVKTFTNNINVSGLITANSGNFTNSLNVNGTGVSISGHTHTSSNITDFNTSVDSRITNANLQPSGNYSVVGHTHSSSNITDFNSSVSGLLPITLLTAGSGIGISGVGSNYTISTTGTFGLTQTQVDSRVNTLTSGIYAPLTGAVFTGIISGPSGSFTSLKVSNVDVSVSGHTHNISDITSLQTTLDNKQPSGNYALSSHDHISSNITDFNTSVSGLVNGIYAPLSSPSFSGVPLTPTATAGTNSTQIASTAFVRTEISNLVASAPTALDTLNELATALGNDANFSTTVTNNLAEKANLSGATFTGSISGPSGNFTSLKVNNVDVSANGHTHTSSNITDFNTSVDSRITNANLQPSGNYSIVGHTHTSSNITDFNSSVSGLLPVKNIISGTDIAVSNSNGTYTISSTASGVPQIYSTVFNNTGSPIPKMSVVYIDGGQGDMPTVALSIADGESTSSKTYAVTTEAISNMSSGRVVVSGPLTALNTDQFNPTSPHGNVNGTTVWLSPTVSGGLTTTKPSAPYHMVAIGTIVRTHQNQGIIEVKIQNGFELHELHNVAINGVTNGQFLQYNSGSGLWLASSSGNFSTLNVNGTGVSISGHTHSSSNITDFNSSVSGLLPVGTANYLSKFGTGGSGLSNSLVFDNGTNVGVGTSTPSGKLDVNGTAYFGTAATSNNLYIRTGQAGVSETALRLRTDTSSNLYLDASNAYVKVGNQSADVDIAAGNAGIRIGNNSAQTLANQNIRLVPANTEVMRITPTGVGIGTTTPSAQLHVIGSGRFSNSVSIGSSTLSDSNLPSIINNTNLYLWSNFN